MGLAELLRKDLRHQPGRTVINLLASLVMVVSYLILVALAQALYDFTAASTSQPNLIVVAGNVVDPVQGRLGDDAIRALEGMRSRGVQKISPVIFRFMRIEDQVYQLRAVPAADWTDVYGLRLVVGKWPESGSQILVGEGVAEAAGWRLGQTLRVYGSDFQIAGVVSAPGTKYMSLWMSLKSGQALFGDRRGFQLLVVQASPEVSLDELRARLEADLKEFGDYEVYLEDALARQYTQAVQDLNQLMVLVLGMALLAITFGSYNATALNLEERRRQVGILRAIGFPPGSLKAYLVNRALLVTGLAFLLGLVVAGLVISRFQAESPIFISSAPVALRLTPVGVTTGLALALLSAALGAWLPARRMLARSVVDLMRSH